MSGETLHEFRPSWTAWFWVIVFTAGLALPFVWLKRRRIHYTVTNTHLKKDAGFIASNTDEFQLDRVTRIRTNQSFTERLFGVGTITLDAGVDEMTIPSVPNHEMVADTIRSVQE